MIGPEFQLAEPKINNDLDMYAEARSKGILGWVRFEDKLGVISSGTLQEVTRSELFEAFPQSFVTYISEETSPLYVHVQLQPH